MNQQLPLISLSARRHPDAREASFHQQLQQMSRIPPVRLLLSHHGGSDLCRVSDPHFMT
jgi:hypothetical protein